jgi:hypothetical protein
MDSGGGYLNEIDSNADNITSIQQEHIEERHIDKIDEAYVNITRKFRKRYNTIINRLSY